MHGKTKEPLNLLIDTLTPCMVMPMPQPYTNLPRIKVPIATGEPNMLTILLPDTAAIKAPIAYNIAPIRSPSLLPMASFIRNTAKDEQKAPMAEMATISPIKKGLEDIVVYQLTPL